MIYKKWKLDYVVYLPNTPQWLLVTLRIKFKFCPPRLCVLAPAAFLTSSPTIFFLAYLAPSVHLSNVSYMLLLQDLCSSSLLTLPHLIQKIIPPHNIHLWNPQFIYFLIFSFVSSHCQHEFCKSRNLVCSANTFSL